MSDLTDAIEAAAALAEVAATAEDAIDIASQYAYGRTITTHGSVAAVEAAVAAAEAIIRADERAKVAEDIARAIERDAESYIGDELLTGMDFAAAIARQHASSCPPDPSHEQNAAMPGEETTDGTNEAPRSHTEPRTGAGTSKDTNPTPEPAQTV